MVYEAKPIDPTSKIDVILNDQKEEVSLDMGKTKNAEMTVCID